VLKGPWIVLLQRLRSCKDLHVSLVGIAPHRGRRPRTGQVRRLPTQMSMGAKGPLHRLSNRPSLKRAPPTPSRSPSSCGQVTAVSVRPECSARSAL